MSALSRFVLTFTAVFFVINGLASAQSRWTVQFHVGGSSSADAGAGALSRPPVGVPMPNLDGRQSRAVSSWLFGDGTELLAQVNAEQGINAPDISPLDPLFARSGLNGGVKPAFGGRITRTLTTRLSIEGAVSFQSGGMELRDEVRQIVDSSASSFVTFWEEFPLNSATGTSIADSSVRYTSEVGHQLLSTAALRVHLAGSRGRSLYGIAGGGLRSTWGQQATASLRGVYNLRHVVGQRFAEIDEVTLAFEVDRHVPVAVLGAGWEQPLSARAGLSLDLRSHIGRSGVSTRLTSAPLRNILAPGLGGVLVTGVAPSVFFSNTPSFPSTLSTPLSNFVVYRDEGMRAQTALSAGLFIRF
jgi:hypothetical protein